MIAELDTAIRQKSGQWTACLVTVIPKKPQRFKKKLTQREVYEIDGASFYELVTEHKTALHDLYYAVEKIAAERTQTSPTDEIIEYCQAALKTGMPE